MALSQLHTYLVQNNTFESFQLEFKANHSSSSSVILVLLDLSATFDTTDHDNLISHLEKMVGIWGMVLEWFKSFLSNRTFSVR